MSTKGEHFDFTGQAHGGVVSDTHGVLILDTNVLSAIYSVVQNGFQLTKPSDRRAANLLRWLAARPDVRVSPLLGVIEGAGFHSGPLDPLVVMQRSLAANIFAAWGTTRCEEWIASGQPAPASLSLPDAAIHPDAVADLGEALLPWTVLPGYVAALAAARVREEGHEGIDALLVFHELLVSRLHHVPAFGWLLGTLLFVGNANVRRDLSQELFKLQNPDTRKVCLSAGWDIGYLELMSITRTPQLAELFDGRTPQLVTDDRRLVPAAMFLRCVADSGVFQLDPADFDPRWCDSALTVLRELQDARLASLAAQAVPTWQGCETAARSLERELGIEAAPSLGLRGGGPIITITPGALRRWLNALLTDNPATALERMTSTFDPHGSVIASGGMLLATLMQLLAEQRDQTPEDVVADLLAVQPAEVRQLRCIQIAVKLGFAIALEDWTLVAVVLRRVALDQHPGFVAIGIHQIGRTLAAALAEGQGLTLIAKVEDLAAKLTAEEPSHSCPRRGPRRSSL